MQRTKPRDVQIANVKRTHQNSKNRSKKKGSNMYVSGKGKNRNSQCKGEQKNQKTTPDGFVLLKFGRKISRFPCFETSKGNQCHIYKAVSLAKKVEMDQKSFVYWLANEDLWGTLRLTSRLVCISYTQTRKPSLGKLFSGD